MVQLIACGVYTHAVKLGLALDLSEFSFFTKHSISEHLNFACRTICSNAQSDARHTVEVPNSAFICYLHKRSDGLCGVVVVDREYPRDAAFAVIRECLEHEWKDSVIDVKDPPIHLVATMKKWKQPHEVDKLLKVQTKLDHVEEIMHQNIHQILQRGQNIEELMEMSSDLSASSKHFYKNAKKTNQCCRMY